MWNKTKEKIKNLWNWTKINIKKVLVGSGIISIAMASVVVMSPESIPVHLQLKVDKSEVLYNYEYTEYEYNEENEIISQQQIVSYGYKSGELAPVLKDEIIEKRTQNIVTRNLGGLKRSAQSGYYFYQENGEWKKIKFATTTPEVFNQVSWIREVFAADTGATSPSIMAIDTSEGTVNWATPDNAKISDDSYANFSTSASDSDRFSYLLKATNFGFSIPSGATIDGIKTEVEGRRGAGNVTKNRDNQVRIIRADDTYGATNKATTANWTTSDVYRVYGGSADLWGETLDDTDINNSNFGVMYQGLLRQAGASFVRGTKVYTKNGLKNIEEIKVGDKIISFDEKTLKETISVVLSTYEVKRNTILTITTEHNEVVTTENQLFYINGELRQASELKKGDVVSIYKGGNTTTEKIESIKIENKETSVYDIIISEPKLYSANNFIVHNPTITQYIDHIRITVTYTEGAPPAESTPQSEFWF